MSVKEIIIDQEFLSQKCLKTSSTQESIIIRDLLDTANEHKEKCAGLAANQIGYKATIFIIKVNDDDFKVIINPHNIMGLGGIKSGYEGCLSRPDEKPIKKRRFKQVRASYFNSDGEFITEIFKGFDARIFQHENDHLKGILI